MTADMTMAMLLTKARHGKNPTLTAFSTLIYKILKEPPNLPTYWFKVHVTKQGPNAPDPQIPMGSTAAGVGHTQGRPGRDVRSDAQKLPCPVPRALSSGQEIKSGSSDSIGRSVDDVNPSRGGRDRQRQALVLVDVPA
ncbi:hypothetical protein FHL15_004483 [Xylaria flabelliformis]|uniref:Uncharacterized protein n=1 Tax=Xylaria flabelliformis TaxID=2512241 RepID=A0A553I3D8_9PEZI|nr:hypothetical protein FHL15_004483 [Xylaria flabelliformis]